MRRRKPRAEFGRHHAEDVGDEDPRVERPHPAPSRREHHAAVALPGPTACEVGDAEHKRGGGRRGGQQRNQRVRIGIAAA